jgi:hypothetical protein
MDRADLLQLIRNGPQQWDVARLCQAVASLCFPGAYRAQEEVWPEYVRGLLAHDLTTLNRASTFQPYSPIHRDALLAYVERPDCVFPRGKDTSAAPRKRIRTTPITQGPQAQREAVLRKLIKNVGRKKLQQWHKTADIRPALEKLDKDLFEPLGEAGFDAFWRKQKLIKLLPGAKARSRI